MQGPLPPDVEVQEEVLVSGPLILWDDCLPTGLQARPHCAPCTWLRGDCPCPKSGGARVEGPLAAPSMSTCNQLQALVTASPLGKQAWHHGAH